MCSANPGCYYKFRKIKIKTKLYNLMIKQIIKIQWMVHMNIIYQNSN